jgi:tRNA dimethylallyltransferase
MPEFLVICGPTASGKSEVGVLLAEALDGEIVSADSMQIYHGLDIGTDKVSLELQQRVPHHMLDIAEPREGYSAARYEREAIAIIEELRARKKVPIVVGGTGLYIRVLINGIFPSPPASSSIRTRLKEEAKHDGIEVLFERLQAIDPAYARVISRNDLRRIVRALEVYELTGSPFSSWHERHRSEQQPRDAFIVGLTRPREELYRRIDTRVDEMFERGLVDEVKNLCDRGYADALRHLRPLGYKEILDYLDGACTLEETITLTKRNSRRYAKRQMTWFRKEDVHWLELAAADTPADAVEKILPLLPADFRK